VVITGTRAGIRLTYIAAYCRVAESGDIKQ